MTISFLLITVPLLVDTACNLVVLISVYLWSRELSRKLVRANDDVWLSLEKAVDIFQCAISCLGVDEVGDGYKSKADACPYNPELVAQILDTG